MDWSEIKPVASRPDVADYPPNTIKLKKDLYYIKKFLSNFVVDTEDLNKVSIHYRIVADINSYPANVDNMASSYQCLQMADGI